MTAACTRLELFLLLLFNFLYSICIPNRYESVEIGTLAFFSISFPFPCLRCLCVVVLLSLVVVVLVCACCSCTGSPPFSMSVVDVRVVQQRKNRLSVQTTACNIRTSTRYRPVSICKFHTIILHILVMYIPIVVPSIGQSYQLRTKNSIDTGSTLESHLSFVHIFPLIMNRNCSPLLVIMRLTETLSSSKIMGLSP